MAPPIAAVAYLWLALGIAYFLAGGPRLSNWQKRSVLFWIASTPVMFFFYGDAGISLILCTALLVFLQPNTIENRIPFIVLVVMAVPDFITAPLPFPGLNYLITADFVKLLAIFSMAPLLFYPRTEPAAKNFDTPAPILLALTYLSVTTIMSARVLPLTSVLRFGVDQLLNFGIPLLVFARVITQRATLNEALKAIVILAILFAGISIVEQGKRWNIYALLEVDRPFWKSGEIRYGLLRTQTTVNSVLTGFVAGLGIVIFWAQRKIKVLRLPYPSIVFGLFMLALLFSLSRGAWVSAAIAAFTYRMLISRIDNSMVALWIGTLMSFAGTAWYLGTIGTEELDPFGTFDYRTKLYEVSWQQFLAAPYLGDVGFRDNGRFDDLVQGEGIVDVVSGYLQIVLEFGLVGLVLFIMPFVMTLWRLMALRSQAIHNKEANEHEDRTLIATQVACLVAYLALIATVSFVSLIQYFGFLLLALANAAISTLASERRKRIMLSPNLPRGVAPDN